ncbi:MAG: GTP cyclohydrolase I FolE [Candidatus Methanoperedens sp.]|nr:GTP cyclohydrolase I FolE [Candidatus Methanoperedens sp.]CAG1009832.1 GTP cyclohydrolase IA [Methanosarcinales archaeon]
MDSELIKGGVRNILRAIGEDPEREGLRETPRRIAQMYEEIFNGYNDMDFNLTVFDNPGYDEMITESNLYFYSMCEHHMLPFFGTAHIGYIPNGKIFGLSKLGRIVDFYAKKLQLQERMTTEIADFLMEKIEPKGCIVVVEAEHMCMSMRGVKKPDHRTITSAIRGIFKEMKGSREEFLRLIR